MQTSQACRQYLRWLPIAKDLSPHTLRAYDSDISAFERYVGGHTAIDCVDSQRVVGFIEQQQAEGLAAKSIRRRLSGLRGFGRWLVFQGLAESNPFAGVSLAAGGYRRLPRTVPAHELARLFSWLRKNAQVGGSCDPESTLSQPYEATTLLAVSLMLTTGARVHEVVAIKCENLDIPGRSLLILGKGRRERRVFLTNDWIANLTSAYVGTRATLGLDHPYLLFNSSRGALSAPALRARLAKAAENARLDLRVTPHMLRHTAATQLIEAGVDIRYIQRLLGHASLTTTELYTHVSDGALNRVVSDADVLAGVLGR